ncbi:DsbA family protein [Streptomyces sp. H39-S7]|uniref:DsbA family protein n=1 Tax=Streptomyces sp. H39-S7 TaxID=3004357 RepID=UPI0022B05D23|nr:DsbA family protein [Streptomyces sp. H39-S7]MCZ4123339.1 DsbA family protein [Streptomyces sp. H39-S7]
MTRGTGTTLEIVEFTDPACPWAWGSEPTFRKLRHALRGAEQAGDVSWRRVCGILFDEDDDPAPDPAAEALWYQEFVAGIAEHTAAPFAHRLERVAVSSWPASLAAKAAEAQGALVAERVLRRLRESTFVVGTPADSERGVRDTVSGVPGLDREQLVRDLRDPATERAVRRDWRETRTPARCVLEADGPGPHGGRAKFVNGRHRYALPTLRLTGPGGTVHVPGWRPYEEYAEAVLRAAPGVSPSSDLLPADEALERYRTLTGVELRLLTGGQEAPGDAVRIETGNGPLWLHPDEARTHPALSHVA